jgi:hypothetical protein
MKQRIKEIIEKMKNNTKRFEKIKLDARIERFKNPLKPKLHIGARREGRKD